MTIDVSSNWEFLILKLVLLPGMDGTGELFAPILPYLKDFDCCVVQLPQSGPQDYQTLKQYVEAKLPVDDFILLAESFSGPIGAILALSDIKNLRAIIFVATFLVAPRKRLLRTLSMVPFKLALKLPFAMTLCKRLLFDAAVSDEITSLFAKTIFRLPVGLIRSRIKAVGSLVLPQRQSDLPAILLQPTGDKLLPTRETQEFRTYFSQIAIEPIAGPHFILQTEPEKCARLITDVLPLLSSLEVQN